MIRNYLLIAIRNLLRYKLHTFINLMGLTIGLACIIVIYLWITDEFSYDKSLKDKDRIYQLTITHPTDILDSNVPYILPRLLANDFSEISHFTRIVRLSNKMTCSFQYKDKDNRPHTFTESNVCLVDSAFLSIFSFSLLYGDENMALSSPSSIILNHHIAEKYFGNENPIGKVLILNGNQNYTVTGVFEQIEKSHLKFDMAMPIPQHQYNDWNWADPSYILTHENSSIPNFKSNIANYFNEHQPYKLQGNFVLGILPITKSYLGFGRMKYIYIFGVVALFILFIAGINYVNLSTANFTKRNKEMMVRKTAGANRPQLIFQLLGESIILSLIALFLAFILVELILPDFNRFFDRSLQIAYASSIKIILHFVLIAISFGVLAGAYPAIFLSTKQLFNRFKSISGISKFRNYAIVGQFTISILLITCSVMVIKQLNYLQKAPLGFDPTHIIEIPLSHELITRFEPYSFEVLKHQKILNITCGQSAPFNEDYKTGGIEWQGKDPDFSPLFRFSITTSGFVETFGMTLEEGRDFLKNYPSDRSNFILNEEAVRYMGLENPIGEKITMWDDEGEIIGIVKDFHHVSLHKKILPQIITINPRHYGALKHIFIKISSVDVQQSIDHLRAITHKFAPETPFEFKFIDDEINKLYQSEQKLSKVIMLFTLIALFISALGVYGMTAFLVDQKSKEIGIRKINGASAVHIVLLFDRKILKWILLATIIAGPVAYGVSFIWLMNFAYKTALSWWVILLSGGIGLVIALATTAYDTIKSALKNPVQSLRYE
jgi:putative ABC transport system permease protein